MTGNCDHFEAHAGTHDHEKPPLSFGMPNPKVVADKPLSSCNLMMDDDGLTVYCS